MVAVIRYFQSIQGSQRAVCSDDYRDLNNWIGIMYQALQVKGERGQVNGLGDREKEVHWKVMEYLNLAPDKLLDKWRHSIFQEVQKPIILARTGKHRDNFPRFAPQNESTTSL